MENEKLQIPTCGTMQMNNASVVIFSFLSVRMRANNQKQ